MNTVMERTEPSVARCGLGHRGKELTALASSLPSDPSV